jgi:hypothetical protein
VDENALGPDSFGRGARPTSRANEFAGNSCAPRRNAPCRTRDPSAWRRVR